MQGGGANMASGSGSDSGRNDRNIPSAVSVRFLLDFFF